MAHFSPGQLSSCTALVPISTQPASRATIIPPNAAFLTQLIACRDGAPAYRLRRREEPEAAARLYERALSLI
jgi:hypothetical protein